MKKKINSLLKMHKNMLTLLFQNKWIGSLFYIDITMAIVGNIYSYKNEFSFWTVFLSFLIVLIYIFTMYQYNKTFEKYYQKKEINSKNFL